MRLLSARLPMLRVFALVVLATTALAGCIPGLGNLPGGADATSWVLRWNTIAVDASGLDHTPLKAGEVRTFGHQLGPTKSSRAMAIIHIAMFDAIVAINGGYQSYTGTPSATVNTSMKAAVSQAARDTLVALYPSHAPTFDEKLAEDLQHIEDPAALAAGVALGQQTAAAILAMRAADGSDDNTPYTPSDQPGFWRSDPLNPGQNALGPNWYKVTPFALTRADQFRVPPPPPTSSLEYSISYAEVKALGGDGVTTSTVRTADQTEAGIYWAYDGTPSLCAPPRLYNQIAVLIAQQEGLDVVQLGRLLALVNIGMADAGIAIWESKYHYNLWRPVTGIRESDVGTGPSSLGDNNPLTEGDATFTPLGAPASNLVGPNFTPPFPAYPSGHAGFGGALFQTLRNFFGTDNIAFTFVSDEYNGVTLDNEGAARPLLPRSFSNFSQAEEENGQSRIYLGIHWSFDKSEGIVQGNRVANFVATRVYQPIP